ncbi:hypothetical protein Y956_15706, partial [Nipponia nippon]
SAQPPGFALRLQQGEDIAFAHRPLDVADDGAARIVHELHTHLRRRKGLSLAATISRPGTARPTHLRALPLGTGPAQHLGYL